MDLVINDMEYLQCIETVTVGFVYHCLTCHCCGFRMSHRRTLSLLAIYSNINIIHLCVNILNARLILNAAQVIVSTMYQLSDTSFSIIPHWTTLHFWTL